MNESAEDEVRILVRGEADIVLARRSVREVGLRVGLPSPAVEALATAVTEIARNVALYAVSGEIVIGAITRGPRRGIVDHASDHGPGIADVGSAMQDGYSTAGSLGLGLPSAKRLVDEFEIASAVGQGTTVKLVKWA